MLIALEDLKWENGLMRWEDGPEFLAKGDWTYFKGDQELELGETGGGLAVWIELRITD